MNWQQVTNEADGEAIRCSVSDGLTIIEWSPCDANGYATDFGFVEIARINPDGTTEYTDDRNGESWTEARTNAVNDCLRLM